MALDPETQDVVKTACDYWVVLARITPVAIVGGFVAFVTNLLRIAHEPSWVGRVLTFISVVSIGCVAAAASALGIELFLIEPSVEIELLVASIAGSSGQKIFDIYAGKLFGLKNSRALSKDSPTAYSEFPVHKDVGLPILPDKRPPSDD